MQRIFVLFAALALVVGMAGPGHAQQDQKEEQPAVRMPEMVVIERPIIESNEVDRFGP